MSWQLWWLFVSVNAVADVTPGPAVMLVLTTALRQGTRAALAAIGGILSSNAIYFALSATALGSLLANFDVFFLVKWLGAAYLVYLGVQSWLARPEAPGTASEFANRPGARLYVDGFVTQASNPKALVYFAAIVPRFLDPSRAVAPQVAILGVTSVALEFCVLLAYAAAAGRGMQLAREPRYAVWTNRISGALLIVVGIGLALTPV